MASPMTPKENYIRAITFAGPHHLPYEDVVRNVEFEGDMMWMGEEGTDRWGVSWRCVLPEYLPMVAEHPVKSPREMDLYRPPEPVFRLKPSTQAMLESLDRERWLLWGFHPNILFERAWFLVGLDNLLMAMRQEPARVRSLLRRIADHQIAIAEQYVRCDIDGVFVGDDYGTQRALIMGPELWRELIKPELVRILGTYKRAGKWVRFHSCGHVTEIVDDLIEIGVDIINPCQARANDLAEWGRRFSGRIVFEGGVDTQVTMTLGTPEEVRAEAFLRIRQLGNDARGGLLLSADQNVPIPEANRRALLDVIVNHGVYPLLT
ncbi:MAG: uroporphyrinogen decarboxylase family protein [Anaerolineae bacterium]|nr:uroporphyrinogen decarboxylase family protein [Anaerolineae bacterium]